VKTAFRRKRDFILTDPPYFARYKSRKGADDGIDSRFAVPSAENAVHLTEKFRSGPDRIFCPRHGNLVRSFIFAFGLPGCPERSASGACLRAVVREQVNSVRSFIFAVWFRVVPRSFRAKAQRSAPLL
jgi:hypothetical protein